MHEATVSVLIAVHNGSMTVARAVRSVLQQTHQCVEVIVVDDHSDDHSWQVIQELAASDARVVPLRRDVPSGGPAVPRNLGLAVGTGNYFALLDQDDYWLPTKLERQLPIFSAHDVGVVYSDCLTSHGASTYLASQERSVPHPTGDVRRDIAAWNFIPACTAVWRRDVTDAIGPFDPALSSVDDRDYWIRAAWAGFRFGHVEAALAVLNTRGRRLSDDRLRHDELTVRMWRQHAQRWPQDPAIRAAERRARWDLSNAVARSASGRRLSTRLSLVRRAISVYPTPRQAARVFRLQAGNRI